MKKAFFSLGMVAFLILSANVLNGAGWSGILPAIVRGVVVSGNYAYLAVEGQGLRILDISDPAKPEEVGAYHTPGNAYEVAVAGRTAYIASGESGVFIFDISNPARPVETGFYDTPGNALSLAISGNALYVADLDKGLRVIDVSNPANPSEVAFYEVETYFMHVWVAGQSAYIFDSSGLMRIMDISNPVHPVEIGWIDYLGNPSELEVVGNFAYVAVAGHGLGIFDISDPTEPGVYGVSPNIVGYYYTPGTGTGRGLEQAQAIAINGHLAYLADGPNGLRVIDISDPAIPREIGSYDTPGSAYDVVVVRNTAYVADWDQGLRIIDISEPTSPKELGFYQSRGLAWNIALVDYVLGIFMLAGFAAALFVHWLSWITRLRYLSVAVVLGSVVFAILATFSLIFMFPEPGSGTDGAYVWKSISIGVWAFLFPSVVMLGAFQARSLPVPWWKGALSMCFETGLGLLMLAAFNYSQRWYYRMPETGLSPGDYQTQFMLSYVISLVLLALVRPLVRLNARRSPHTIEA